MKKSCVIGWPVSHSRSPIIHNYWLRKYHIQSQYERCPVAPAQLGEFVKHLSSSDYLGCNVTIPHKESVFPLLDAVDEKTRKLGAVNTIYIRDGRLCGTNTDGEGFIANLEQAHPSHRYNGSAVCILGAGGAATSVISSLIDHGIEEIRLVNRTTERSLALRDKYGPSITVCSWEYHARAMADCGLLVNTTALGMQGQSNLEVSLEFLPRTAVVADIVYIPLETELLKSARARGNPIVGGLGMLLHQAVRGFELWYGVRPAVTRDLHDLVVRDIESGGLR